MGFESDYNNLVSFCKVLLKSNSFTLLPEDLVNDAYIKFIESKKDYSFETVTRIIKKSFYGELFESQNQDPTERERFCRKCNDTKPIAAFTFYWSERRKKQIVSEYCLECINDNRKVNGYDKKYKKLQSENLTDVYIKDVIRRHFKGEITQQMIEEKRTKISIKRSKHKLNYQI
jgi:hypothetical protein